MQHLPTEATWLRLFLRDVGHAVTAPTTIYADNKSAITLATNPEYHARTKHIDIQYHYVREKVDNGTVEFTYIPTRNMAADGLTKPLMKQKFATFMQLLRLK